MKFTHSLKLYKHHQKTHCKREICPKCLIVKCVNAKQWTKHLQLNHHIPCNHHPLCSAQFVRKRDKKHHLEHVCLFAKEQKKSIIILEDNTNYLECVDETNDFNINNIEEEKNDEQLTQYVIQYNKIIFDLINQYSLINVDLYNTNPDISQIEHVLLELCKHRFIDKLHLLYKNKIKSLTTNQLQVLFFACNIDPKKSMYYFINGIKEISCDDVLNNYKVNIKAFTQFEQYNDIENPIFNGNYKNVDILNKISTFRVYPNIFLSSTVEIFNTLKEPRCKITFNGFVKQRNYIDFQYILQGRIFIMRLYPYWIQSVKILKFENNISVVILKHYQCIFYGERFPVPNDCQYKESDLFGRIPFLNNKSKYKTHTICFIINQCRKQYSMEQFFCYNLPVGIYEYTNIYTDFNKFDLERYLLEPLRLLNETYYINANNQTINCASSNQPISKIIKDIIIYQNRHVLRWINTIKEHKMQRYLLQNLNALERKKKYRNIL